MNGWQRRLVAKSKKEQEAMESHDRPRPEKTLSIVAFSSWVACILIFKHSTISVHIIPTSSSLTEDLLVLRKYRLSYTEILNTEP